MGRCPYLLLINVNCTPLSQVTHALWLLKNRWTHSSQRCCVVGRDLARRSSHRYGNQYRPTSITTTVGSTRPRERHRQQPPLTGNRNTTSPLHPTNWAQSQSNSIWAIFRTSATGRDLVAHRGNFTLHATPANDSQCLCVCTALCIFNGEEELDRSLRHCSQCELNYFLIILMHLTRMPVVVAKEVVVIRSLLARSQQNNCHNLRLRLLGRAMYFGACALELITTECVNCLQATSFHLI